MLTTKEICRLIGTKPWVIANLIRTGKLSPPVIHGGSYVWTQKDAPRIKKLIEQTRRGRPKWRKR